MKTEKITRSLLARLLNEQFGLPLEECHNFVDLFFTSIVNCLSDQKDVKIHEFGTFCIKNRKARVGRNIKTGEMIPISPTNSVDFIISQKLKSIIRDNAKYNK